MKLESGTRWTSNGSSSEVFIILHVIEQDNHTWVHYRRDDNKSGTPEEFSCYQESFVSRFSPLPK